MSAELLKLILWIPFLLVFLSVGVPFCFKGFRKGIFHALISTGATVVAILISFFAAKILASLAMDKVMLALPDFSDEAGSAAANLIPMLIEGLVTSLLAVILFSLLLAILMPICKWLLALIPVPKAKGLITRLLGMTLRLAEGLVVTMLLLLPLYGTVAVYGPAVDIALAFTDSPSIEDTMPDSDEATGGQEIRELVQCAITHPVVTAAKSEPFSVVYNALSSAGTDGSTVNVPKMVQSITQSADAFQSIMDGDITFSDFDALAEIPVELVETDWFYALFSELSASMNDALGDLGADAPTYATAMQKLTALPKEEFTQCCTGILDWLEFADEKGLFQVLENRTLDGTWIAESGIMQKTLEIQQNMPDDFPFMSLITQFFADYLAQESYNNPLTEITPGV